MKQTKALIFINILFSLVITILSYNSTNLLEINPEVLKNNGAIIPQNSHFITLITGMFLHGSYFHLCFNMLSLYVIGKRVEPIFKNLYLPVYLILGVFINFLGYFWYTPETFIIGASGSICIIWGASLFLNFKKNKSKLQKEDSIDIIIFISFTLIVEIFNLSIANFIHIVGIILGLSFSYLFLKFKTRSDQKLILIK